MNKKTKILHHLSIIVCLLAASGLWTELYLSNLGKSLCQTSACAIVTKFVRFGEPLLISMGAGYFLILAGFILFAGRYAANPFVRTLPILSLVGAAAFDGALLGFQFITLRQHCHLCITVALALGLITLLYSASRKKWSILFAFFTAWAAGFAANSLLIMPDTTETHTGMIFYERPAAKKFINPPVATLIFSLKCPHCTEVLEAMAKQNLNSITWRFAITDDASESYNKLGYFYSNLPSSTNPFQLLLDAKESQAKFASKDLSKKLTEQSRQTRLFLTTNGLRGVPVLVFNDTTDGRITLLPGSPNILSFLCSLKHDSDKSQMSP